MKRLLCFALACCAAAHLAAAPKGWRFHRGHPGKPAVLLIHGLAASSQHWTNPGATWSIENAHYDHRKNVKDRTGSGKGPHMGVQGFARSPVDPGAGKDGSFWTYLTALGFTVATWDQAPCMDEGKRPSRTCLDGDTFDAAYPSAKEALATLAELSGGAPIALVGHSRGGLVARRLLKDAALPGRNRVRWLITLHSPHQGSSMATAGVALQKKIRNLDSLVDLDFLPEAVQKPARKLLPGIAGKLDDTLDMLVDLTGMEGARELAAHGELLKALRAGEAKPAGVRVVTFGGTSPRVVRLHAFVYTKASADPFSKSWRAEPHEVFDFPADLRLPFPEMKLGGDLLVTDESSHLPWEDQHITHTLNHAEVLWSRTVQKQVAELLTP